MLKGHFSPGGATVHSQGRKPLQIAVHGWLATLFEPEAALRLAFD